MSLKSRARKNGRSTLRQMAKDLVASRTSGGVRRPVVVLYSSGKEFSEHLETLRKR